MLIRDAIAECRVSNEVFEVANGEEALEFLRRKGKYANAPRPGLIFLDIEMPGMDGQTRYGTSSRTRRSATSRSS